MFHQVSGWWMIMMNQITNIIIPTQERITEAGDDRITENGQIRETE